MFMMLVSSASDSNREMIVYRSSINHVFLFCETPPDFSARQAKSNLVLHCRKLSLFDLSVDPAVGEFSLPFGNQAYDTSDIMIPSVTTSINTGCQITSCTPFDTYA